MEITVKLGDKVIDKVSGFCGIIVSEHNYLNGCTRFTVQPVIDKEGKLPLPETFDGPQLEVVKNSVSIPRSSNDTGGPEKYSDSRRY
jgi:hypothetical protein